MMNSVPDLISLYCKKGSRHKNYKEHIYIISTGHGACIKVFDLGGIIILIFINKCSRVTTKFKIANSYYLFGGH